MKLKSWNLAAALAITCAVAAPAGAVDITATGSGWIRADEISDSGGFATGTNNHYTGVEYQLYNNFFSFSLPNFAITSATLNIWNKADNTTSDPLAVYSLHEATAFSFAGLMAGADFGSIALSVADTGVDHWVAITLNAAGLAALNANLGGTFNFGGTVATTVDIPTCYDCVAAFGYNDGNPESFLSLNVAAVPEPETYAMMLAGLGLLGFAARRRKQNAA